MTGQQDISPDILEAFAAFLEQSGPPGTGARWQKSVMSFALRTSAFDPWNPASYAAVLEAFNARAENKPGPGDCPDCQKGSLHHACTLPGKRAYTP